MTDQAAGDDPELARDERIRHAADQVLRHPVLWGLLLIAVMVAGVLGYLAWADGQRFVTTDDAFIQGDIAHVATEMSGRITQVLVENDQAVRKGQRLALIDVGQAAAKLDQAAAGDAAATAQIAQSHAQIASAEAATQQAAAAVRAAQAQAGAARNELARLLALQELSATAVSRQQIDTARAASEAAQAHAEAARGQALASSAQREAAVAQSATAQAQLRSATAQHRQASLNLSYAEVISPIDGHVAQKAASPGNMIQAGQEMMAVVPLKLWVIANLKETQLEHVRRGQAAEFVVEAYPQKVFHGHVASVQYGSGQAFSLLPSENASGNYVKVVQRVPVRIAIDDPVDGEHPIGPGMSVRPRIRLR